MQIAMCTCGEIRALCGRDLRVIRKCKQMSIVMMMMMMMMMRCNVALSPSWRPAIAQLAERRTVDVMSRDP